MLKFLHLSDLHFSLEQAGTVFDRDLKIREALMSDLGTEGRSNFTGIFVTGDVAYHGKAGEFLRAKAWLEQVRLKCNCSEESIYVVPGNHDVDRSIVKEDSSLWDLHQSLRQINQTKEERFHRFAKKLQDPFDFLAAQADFRAFAQEYDCATSAAGLAWIHVLSDTQFLEDGTVVRIHGLNTAVLSDGADTKGNLLLGPSQFHHFNSEAGYVNLVLCHHPPSWLLDENDANDFLRNQAQLVLCGHEHDERVFRFGDSLRIHAGAVHPNPREPNWQPCYHTITLSVNTQLSRKLTVQIETRVWHDKEKCFGALARADGTLTTDYELPLRPWVKTRTVAPATSQTTVGQANPMKNSSTSDEFAAARRKLIVHFFRLGVVSRYEVVVKAGVWEESDDSLEGQARWTRIFDRAEKNSKLGALWREVASKDPALSQQSNPF